MPCFSRTGVLTGRSATPVALQAPCAQVCNLPSHSPAPAELAHGRHSPSVCSPELSYLLGRSTLGQGGRGAGGPVQGECLAETCPGQDSTGYVPSGFLGPFTFPQPHRRGRRGGVGSIQDRSRLIHHVIQPQLPHQHNRISLAPAKVLSSAFSEKISWCRPGA